MKDSIRTNIEETAAFTEWDACVGAGLDVERWENGGYPQRLKANAMAWHRFHNLKAAHIQDIVAHAPGKK